MGYWKVVVPQAGINYAKNPSFEHGLDEWTADGSNTLEQSSDYALFGNYSGKLTYVDTADPMAHITATVDNNAHHQFSAWVYLTAAWDQSIYLALDWTGSNMHEQDGTSQTGQWVKLTLRFTPTGTLTGDIGFRVGTPPSGGVAYIDGIMLEEVDEDEPTTFITGDLPGHFWRGAKGSSVSERKATTTEGGKIVDLADIGFVVEQVYGAGMPPVQHLAARRALLDGQEFQRTRIPHRVFRLRSSFVGSTLSDYHAERRAFIESIRPDDKDQAYIFRYSGAGGLAREIRARYDRGLEMRGPQGFNEKGIWVQFVAHNPFFERVGNSSVALDVNNTVTSYGDLARIDGVWQALSTSAPNTNAVINAVAISNDGGTVYFGGNFEDFDGITGADFIVQYDVADGSFSLLGGSGDFNNIVNDLLVAPDGTLYATGTFTNVAGDGDADFIAQWNGSSWSAVGTPSAGSPSGAYAMVTDEVGGLYVGVGGADWAGISGCDVLAYWDGSSWTRPGADHANHGNPVEGLEWGLDGKLYIGGSFVNLAGISSADYFARYDPDSDAFEAVLIDTLDGAVENVLRGPGGELYIGGWFTQWGSEGVVFLGVYNGQEIAQLGEGIADGGGAEHVERLRFDNEGRLWVTGYFTETGDGLELDDVVIWNGVTFVKPEFQNEDSPATHTGLAIRGDDLYMTFGSSISGDTIDVGGVTTVTNDGSAKAYPVLYFKSDGAARLTNVVNITTGRRLYFDYNLAPEEELTVDLRPGSRKMVSSVFGSQWKILPGSDVSDFYLRPGDNEILAFVEDDGTSPTVVATIRWRHTDWSVD